MFREDVPDRVRMNQPDDRVTYCFRRLKSADMNYPVALEAATPDTVYRSMYEVCKERFAEESA
jgi:hypothetical protein